MAYRFVEVEKFSRRITILSNSGVKVSTLVKISFQLSGVHFSNIDTVEPAYFCHDKTEINTSDHTLVT